MPKDKPSGKKTDLTEQRLLDGTQEEKGEFSTFGRKGGNSGGLQGCSEVMQMENQLCQSSTST